MFPSKRFELLTTTFLVVALLVSAATPAAAASGHYEFADNEFTGEQGEVIAITVEASGDANDTTTVHIGNQDQGFLVHATAVDENGDGEVTLELNTTTAAQTDPSSYLSAAGDDSVTNLTQSSRLLSNLLDPGSYDLRVGSMDDPNDTAVLSIKDNDSVTDPISETPTDPISETPVPTPPEDPDFEHSVVTVTPGVEDTAQIPVVFGSNGTATLTIESVETGYNTSVELADGNGDYKTNVSIDLTATDESPEEYISVSNGDRIESISWNESTTDIETPHEYDLRLSDSNETVNVGVLAVTEKQIATDQPATDADANASPTANGTTNSTAKSTDTGIPGFGASIAVVALAGAALLAARR
ncbi:PGF-CTERM sorting domain-containing protein [Haloferax mediterranei ATCC 33500]|uniref:LysR family transcriptional regulator n=1 Tax=Haloferax mediterranei (strain ATCC 33500 / DSM 1411 / JCM 8866 / NBRC 14739 / NCIMB 2177 / R-4) TaxID=523841 RepID=I3R145_HALMT|nr:PGF-CTERM sorting domain-containing protein [Haloferax mediterranei]AFK17955.1 hypothetical protein HFX_0214 [Haloferax mediterranei ATCC 33500]AHZ22623.1 LysR family transcriptional regulator [Haloferax mediterranei ATCC 33500]EMA02767.1 hypothetical protein C439_09300 [Haloferax mediterranei ATCC 33500]MDX5988048.1 PGF-CTERM sorting domain-containing protein [Haloferax mediterranei ATCC 33500]QCQ74507.1 PGF-CTERM sorting domain-containing protein [Haloferax mediterranei ATCC 33500]